MPAKKTHVRFALKTPLLNYSIHQLEKRSLRYKGQLYSGNIKGK